MHMARMLLGAVAGLVSAVVTIMLIEFAGQQVYPPPPGLDPGNSADMAKWVGMMPMGALLFIVAAWVLGAFEGGLVAALIAGRSRPRVAALIPALMVMVGVVAMIVAMPAHPTWMAMAGLLLPLPAALAGALLAGKLRKPGPA